jgi:hypothetical protein
MLQQTHTYANTGLQSFADASPDYDIAPVGLGSMQQQAQKLAEYGRNGDIYVVHAAEGETVVPMEVLNANPKVKELLFNQMKEMGLDPQEFVIGDDLNSINPVTGMPEFFFKSIFRGVKKAVKKVIKVAKKIAPIALPLIAAGFGFPFLSPTIFGAGSFGATALAGGLSTLAQGGSFKDALKSGLMSGGIASLSAGFMGPGSFGENISKSFYNPGAATFGQNVSRFMGDPGGYSPYSTSAASPTPELTPDGFVTGASDFSGVAPEGSLYGEINPGLTSVETNVPDFIEGFTREAPFGSTDFSDLSKAAMPIKPKPLTMSDQRGFWEVLNPPPRNENLINIQAKASYPNVETGLPELSPDSFVTGGDFVDPITGQVQTGLTGIETNVPDFIEGFTTKAPQPDLSLLDQAKSAYKSVSDFLVPPDASMAQKYQEAENLMKRFPKLSFKEAMAEATKNLAQSPVQKYGKLGLSLGAGAYALGAFDSDPPPPGMSDEEWEEMKLKARNPYWYPTQKEGESDADFADRSRRLRAPYKLADEATQVGRGVFTDGRWVCTRI